jgi:hypothetical protein
VKPVIFTPAAEADVEEAFSWYEAQREGLGLPFSTLSTSLCRLWRATQRPIAFFTGTLAEFYCPGSGTDSTIGKSAKTSLWLPACTANDIRGSGALDEAGQQRVAGADERRGENGRRWQLNAVSGGRHRACLSRLVK